MGRCTAEGEPRLPFALFPALGCLLFAAAGCASVADDATQQDVAQLRRDVNALKLSTNLGRGQTDAVAQVERRSREQSADTNRQLTAMSTRLEAIAAELNRVSARLDDLSRRVDPAGRQSSCEPSAPRPEDRRLSRHRSALHRFRPAAAPPPPRPGTQRNG